MFPGRNDEIKKNLAEKLLKTAAEELQIPAENLSVSVEDVDPKKFIWMRNALSVLSQSGHDKDKCISCMHCVAVCPKKARNYSKLVSFIAGLKMKKVCSGRKENKLYL